MNRFKTLTLLAAMSMLATVACKKDEKKDAPASDEATEAAKPADDPAAKPDEAAKPDTAEPAVADGDKPDSMATIDGMIGDCDTSKDARDARHAAKPLYERLGGHDALLAFTLRVIELHKENDPIKDLFLAEGLDTDKLAAHFVDYVGAGTGGKEKYTGRDMAELHHPMNLTADQVLAAGGDIMKALAEFKVPADESEEVMCLILAHKDALIKPAAAAGAEPAAAE